MRRLRATLPLLLAAAFAACSPLYVLQAGVEEARILSRRRPIARVIEDPATDSVTRHKLRLVLQARDYAHRVLGLDAGDSYTTYSYVDSDTLLMVVSGARKDRFEAHTWWFPIVGHVPYKGFFDFDDAYDEAARLERAGYDAYVRPSGAFSTLGWFNDPLLNTLLRYDDVSLAGTVIHEILHNTVYVPSRIAFNESFASFVGERGAIAFFCDRDGAASRTCTAAQDSWHDQLLYGDFLTGLVTELEALYGSDVAYEEKLRRREQLFAAAKERFTAEVEPRLRTGAYRGFTRRPLNNATLIGTRLYYDRLHLFDDVFRHYAGDVAAATHAIIAAARTRPDDPWTATAALLDAPPRLVPPGRDH